MQDSSDNIKVDIHQEISKRHTPNDKCENFITSHLEAAAECILTKARAKCRVLWESVAVRRKWEKVKKASLLHKRKPANGNA